MIRIETERLIEGPPGPSIFVSGKTRICGAHVEIDGKRI